MKIIIIHEGQKNTIQGECKPSEAMEIIGLNPKEWKVTSKDITDKAVTYRIERKSPAMAPVAEQTPSEEQPVIHPLKAQTENATTHLAVPPLTITVPRDALQEVLSLITDIIQKNMIMPILTTVKLVSTPDTLTLSATDLDPCVGDSIALCVDASLLFREVKALHKEIEEITLSVTSDTVKINDRCTLPSSEIDDFPELVTVEGPLAIIDSLADALRCVLPAVSEDQSRYVLTGVYFDFTKGKVVATDGFRLHMADIEAADVPSLVLPRRSAALLYKYGATDLTFSEKYIASPILGGIFTARTMSGTFPDVETVMPDVSAYHKASFIASEFIELMPGVLPVSEGAVIDMTINGRIDIETQSASGSYKWYVPADTTLEKNTSKKLRLNCRYLMDAIKAYAFDENVILCFPDEGTYGAITINDKALIMPMRY
jgi:DNA polymerase III sliding clamp (beta) subunit (PCNA family)